MERSEWADDESASSPVPPPERRAWRHPSELGRNPAALPTPGCARPRSNRLAIAVAAGTAGTLAIASIGVAAFSRDHHRTTTTSLEASNADALTVSFVSPRTTQPSDAFTTLARITSTVDSATASQGTDNGGAGNTSTNPGSSTSPAVITLSRPDRSGDDVAAVVTDAGALWAVAEDVIGADHLEVATIDGDMVKVTVGHTDPETGLVELHPTKPIAAQPSGPVTWLGVNCSDEYIEPSTTTPSSPAASDSRGPAATANVPDGQSSPTTISAVGSANGARAGDSPAGSTTVATKPTSNPAGRTTTASVAAVTTTIAPAAPVAVAVATPTTRSAPTTTPADGASGSGDGTKTSRAPATVPGSIAAATTSLPATDSGSASSPDTVDTTVAGATSGAATNNTTNDTTTTTSDQRSPQAAWPAGEPALGGSHVRGVHVHGVVDASPAASVGLRPGDVILAADGRPVRTVWALVLAVRRHAPGEHLTMLIRRDGSLVELSATLSRHSAGQT